MGRAFRIRGVARSAFVVVACWAGWAILSGGFPPVEAGPADSAPADEEQAKLREAQEHVSRLELRDAEETSDAIDCIDHALLSYGDPARGNTLGTLWAFGASGRPVAFLELWRGGANETVWYQSVISTSDRKIVLKTPFGRNWTPPKRAIARPVIEDTPRPEEEKGARLRQLKSMGKRFTAHEIGDPDRSRAELRLLVQPIHRYQAANQGIQDGAAFVFAHGTNPELVLLVEAMGETVAEAKWRYCLFPSSSAELHAELDGVEVWTRPGAPGVVGQPTDDYWLFSLPVESPAK